MSMGSRENKQNKVRTQLWDTLYHLNSCIIGLGVANLHSFISGIPPSFFKILVHILLQISCKLGTIVIKIYIETSTSNPFLCAADFFLQLGSCEEAVR